MVFRLITQMFEFADGDLKLSKFMFQISTKHCSTVLILRYFQNIEKRRLKMPREGVYANNAKNRALGRVGKPYGTAVVSR